MRKRTVRQRVLSLPNGNLEYPQLLATKAMTSRDTVGLSRCRMYSLCRIGIATICTLGLLFGCGGDEDAHMTRLGCCLVCTDGKACGDTCIPAILNCIFPPGCACTR